MTVKRQTTYEQESLFNPGQVEISGSFVCNTTSAPATTRGRGYSVGAPSTGVYTMTMTQRFDAAYSLTATLLQPAAGNDDVKITAFDPAPSAGGNATVTIETQSADGTAANLDTDREVHFCFKWRHSGRSV